MLETSAFLPFTLANLRSTQLLTPNYLLSIASDWLGRWHSLFSFFFSKVHCHVVKTKDKEHGKEKRMQSFDSTWGISQKNKEMCSETERGSYNYCTDHV